jgi:hypothetical protein
MIAVAELELTYHTSLRPEKILTTSKIEFPHTNKPVVIMLANAGTVFEKCLTPLFERFLIMAAHDLNIGDF